jgi:hypothetical protein
VAQLIVSDIVQNGQMALHVPKTLTFVLLEKDCIKLCVMIMMDTRYYKIWRIIPVRILALSFSLLLIPLRYHSNTQKFLFVHQPQSCFVLNIEHLNKSDLQPQNRKMELLISFIRAPHSLTVLDIGSMPLTRKTYQQL